MVDLFWSASNAGLAARFYHVPVRWVCLLLQVLVCLAASVAMTACAVFPERFDVVFASFLLLEISVGSSYAAYATLRARVIPEVPSQQTLATSQIKANLAN